MRRKASPKIGQPVAGLVHRRRRGAELEDAICRAAFQELSESGYGAFTIESVAARAQTGKASIYRRWPGKDELLLDAFTRGIPQSAECFIAQSLDDSVTTREALVQILSDMLDSMAGGKKSAMQAIASEAARDPEFAQAIDRLVAAPRRAGLIELFQRGIARGEVHPDAPLDLLAETVPAFFISRFVFRHADMNDAQMLRFIDDILLPVMNHAGRPADGRAPEPALEPALEPASEPASEPAAEEQLRYV